jgi:hypothetical protein
LTVVAPGVSTGVTIRSRPIMNCLSNPNSIFSWGNSNHSARIGGVPYVEALANRVYYIVVMISPSSKKLKHVYLPSKAVIDNVSV